MQVDDVLQLNIFSLVSFSARYWTSSQVEIIYSIAGYE